MADRRSSFKRHIRAAREWLGQAETSLDKKNDVRGDLKLMLAEAELKRARETGEISKSQGWFRRVLPFGMAVILAAGGFFFLQLQRPGNRTDSVQAVVQGTAAMPEEPDTPGISEQTGRQEPQPEVSAAPKLQQKPVQEAALLNRAEPQEVQHPAAEKAAVQPEAKPAGQTAMPSEHMQQLMQSAGKTLRAQ